jgi:hypothetical protein
MHALFNKSFWVAIFDKPLGKFSVVSVRIPRCNKREFSWESIHPTTGRITNDFWLLCHAVATKTIITDKVRKNALTIENRTV